MLGLVAMATTVDNLYASMKALVCIIGDNQVALKEMERTGGFQVGVNDTTNGYIHVHCMHNDRMVLLVIGCLVCSSACM